MITFLRRVWAFIVRDWQLELSYRMQFFLRVLTDAPHGGGRPQLELRHIGEGPGHVADEKVLAPRLERVTLAMSS